MGPDEEAVAGEHLAQLGADIYCLADAHPEIEKFDDFTATMFFLNKLSYRLLHGRERGETATAREMRASIVVAEVASHGGTPL